MVSLGRKEESQLNTEVEGIKPNQASQVTRPRTKPDQSEGSAGQLEAVAELPRTEGVLCHEHGVRAQSGSLAPSSHAQGEEKGWGKKKTTEEIPVIYMRQNPELSSAATTQEGQQEVRFPRSSPA